MVSPALALALLLLPGQVGLGVPALELSPTVHVLLGYDSNAKRVPYAVPREIAVVARGADAVVPAVVGDGFLQASAAITGTARARDLVLRFDGAAGTKLFTDARRPDLDEVSSYPRARAATRTDTERIVVAEGRAFLMGRLPYDIDARLSVQGKLRAQASGARTYGFERTDLVFSLALPMNLVARAGLAGQAFHSIDLPLFSSFGGGADAGLTWLMTPRESLDVEVGALQLAYPFARAQPDDEDVRRLDLPLHASLVFTSARRVFVSSGYVLFRNNSNAFAESYTRHRLFAMVGFRLPAQVTVSTRGAVQLTHFDEGVSISRQFFLQEDDESQNSVSLLVTRPFIAGLHLEARLAWYGNELARGGVRFSRTTAAMGIRAEL